MTPPTPSIANDLVRIHKVITRAIDVDLIKSKQYLKNGLSDPQELAGFTSYTHCLVEVLIAHHQGEDGIFFPELNRVIPNAPYARLTAEHHQIERLLSLMRPALESLPLAAAAGLDSLADSLTKLSALWPPHYQTEEANFTPDAVNAVLSVDEQVRIGTIASQFSQEHSGPPYLVVPFVLFNLDSQDRADMAASLPPMVVEELVPKAWKEQWAPMKPLLLD